MCVLVSYIIVTAKEHFVEWEKRRRGEGEGEDWGGRGSEKEREEGGRGEKGD